MLYYSFIYPHLLYGTNLYGNCDQASLKKLQVLQNKIIMCLFKNRPSDKVKNLYIKYQILNVKSIISIQRIKFAFNLIKNSTFPQLHNEQYKKLVGTQ